MAVSDRVLVSSIDPAEFEPFVVQGVDAGEVHWLREPEGPDSCCHSGVYRVRPGMYPDGVPVLYEHPCNEVLQVLEGTLTVEFADGLVRELGPGDVALFTPGTRSIWTIRAPFRKFFVEVSDEL